MLDFILHFYNSNQKYLELSIKSIIDQTYQNWFLYLRDDGSHIELSPAIKTLIKDNRIILTGNAVNKGVPYTFNKNFDAGNNKYIAATSDDNLYDETFAEEMLDFAEAGEYEVVTSFERWIDPNGRITKTQHDPRRSDHCLGQHGFKVKYLGGNGASSIWKRGLCEKAIEVFKEPLCDLALPGIEDFDIFCKFRELGASFGFLEKVLYSYRLGTSSFKVKKVIESRLKFAKKWRLQKI